MPGLARVKDSTMILISSPYKRSGLLYDRWAACYGKNDPDTLVVQGGTLDFNPSFDKRVIEAALAQDKKRFSAEFLGHWRDDISSYISRDLLDAATDTDITVRPPREGVTYIAGCDGSGGRSDSFTAAIASKDGEDIILDCLYERRAPSNLPR